jgi:hypothetical protein
LNYKDLLKKPEEMKSFPVEDEQLSLDRWLYPEILIKWGSVSWRAIPVLKNDFLWLFSANFDIIKELNAVFT